MLASVPGNSATVDDALAITGGSPAAIMAGKLTNEPPPAMAFIAPANRPAAALYVVLVLLRTDTEIDRRRLELAEAIA